MNILVRIALFEDDDVIKSRLPRPSGHEFVWVQPTGDQVSTVDMTFIVDNAADRKRMITEVVNTLNLHGSGLGY